MISHISNNQVGGHGSCPGDSGGPLVKYITDEPFGNGGGKPFYKQLAIVHGGVRKCGDREFPGIYARIEDHDNWNFIMSSIGRTEKGNS